MDWAYGRWKYDYRNLGLLEDEDIVLDLAALQIASLDHPRHSSSGLIDMLTGMAVELARIVTPEHTTARQAIALEGVFVRRGFRGGDRPAYPQRRYFSSPSHPARCTAPSRYPVHSDRQTRGADGRANGHAHRRSYPPR
jgi:hypothetical protein